MWQHIKENASKKGVFIDFVNGYSDHCHCLVSLGVDQTIQKVVQLIKGESSYWFNKEKITNQKFEWQNENFAVSVSESMIETVRNYIRNQEKHHLHKTFQEEYNEFMSRYAFQNFSDK